jgi:1-acyl-sn-glycerol-3-phosphate acyltransferase
VVRRQLDLRIEGLHHLPPRGPVILVCRHYHHYFDGCILLATARRTVRVLVSLDWVRTRRLRVLMEAACRTAGWPVVLRAERMQPAGSGAFDPREARSYLRQALALSTATLRGGEILAIFPEGYPNIDPVYTPKASIDAYLPFRHGYARLALAAQRAGSAPVALVPVGLSYPGEAGGRHRVTVRFGPPQYLERSSDALTVTRQVEQRVRALSDH